MSVGCRARKAWWQSPPPPPSPCRRWGSSGFQRLKAKLLESLCFYPPICSHLAGLGGGAARAGCAAGPEVPMAAESWFFVLAQTALGFGDGRLPGVRWVMHGQRGSRQLVCQQHHGLQSYRPGRPWRWAPQTVVCACLPPPPALARSASARDSTRPAREAQATPCPGRWGGGPPRPEESQGGGREPAEVSGVHSCGARCRPGEEACRLNTAPSSFSLRGHGPASPPTWDLGHLAAPESAVGRRLRPGLRTRGRCSGEGGQENREASWRMWRLTP